VPRLPPTYRTYSARTAGRTWLQPVRLDRAFRELSNGVGFVDFACLGAGIQNPESFYDIPYILVLGTASILEDRYK
jgi:hypothetical protein